MSQIKAVKDTTDIVEVIGARVSLQRSGANWRGLCPFHSEKSPSFFVSEQMQRYRCFGCGKSGDVFTFLQEYEGMTFYEALENLAQKVGIVLEKTGPSDEDKLRVEVLQALDLAKEYYHYLLTQHKVGAAGRAYAKERQISNDSVKLFQLGYSLDQWDGLIKFLHAKKKIPLDTLVAAGLVIKSQNRRYYDRFRSRLMFPLRNHRGQIVGFSGRILPSASVDKSDEKQAKYINSPETICYHKSQLLYGFSELYQQIRQEKQVVVVEGELDVIGSVQAHVNSVVAIKGSALTEHQVKLLARVVDQIILCLDADSAGVEATKKAIRVVNATDISRETPLELRVTRIPAGKDPDELSKEDPKLWRETTKRTVTAYEFLIQVAFEQNDATSSSGKQKIMRQLSPILAEISHAVELEHYVRLLAERLGASNVSVAKDIEAVKQKKLLVQPKTANEVSADQPTTKLDKLENYAWFLLFQSQNEQLAQRAEILTQLALKLPGAHTILKTILQNSQLPLNQINARLPDDLQQTVFNLYSQKIWLAKLEDIDVNKEWRQAIHELRAEQAKIRSKAITSELEKIDQVREKTPAQLATQEDLLRELVQLRK